MSINRVILLGNVGQDPQIKGSGENRVANLSLATSKRWTDKRTGEKREATEWHRVVIFNQTIVGVVEKWVSKGSKISVEGALRTRKWRDDKDEIDRYSTEVIVDRFDGGITLEGGPADRDQASPARQPANAPAGGMPDDDEIPF
jgi:single-strand DNA-binding protein